MNRFDKLIDRSNSNSFKWEKYPKGVLPLWVADMDYEVADPIKKAVQNVTDHGVYGYATIPEKLIATIISRLKNKHNWDIKADWIVVLPGLVPGLFNTSALFPGHSVKALINTPVYHHFIYAAKKQILVDIPFTEDKGAWALNFDRLEAEFASGIKIYFLCNPHNPLGYMFSELELKKIGELAVKYDVLICSDEIHCDLVLSEDKKHISLASLSEDIALKTITLISPSKTFNIAGLGCSFAIIPDPIVRQKYKDAMFGIMPMVSSFAYEAAHAAYEESNVWHSELIEYLKGIQDYLFLEINKIPGLEMKKLDATYLAWIDYSALKRTNLIAELEAKGLGVQDGKGFGGGQQFRLNFATQKVNIEKAVEILKNI